MGPVGPQAGKPVDDLGTVCPARAGLACPGELICTATSFDRLSIAVIMCVVAQTILIHAAVFRLIAWEPFRC